ncbi:uncharacterized protein N7484_011933 [Penicillium longicatenatum]|uniref:uncharacterized protein n=1 Tax=Penicillium longicatenatum TaxID=1561947 RepID=UPI002546AFB2|nr:uncharacterized protein N7484_011933 [Penicillium longicatenatum]KAJ5631833.1 hypothetical protein N7484_011933 [Penicillium longicatenatum]KAJ5658969.1 hypothetical protein N7507_005420 [Penicillium longicatenatum]
MVVKACNRCHAAKEKCTFNGSDQQCLRCRRLKIPCSISRRSGRIGRRPSAKAFPHGQMQVWSVETREQPCESELSSSKASSRAPSRGSDTGSQSDATEELGTPNNNNMMMLSPERLIACPKKLQTQADALQTVLDVEQFSVIHTPFMLGSSFIPEAQKTVYAILTLCGPTLTEGYLAFLGMMTRHQRSLVLRPQPPDMRKAAKGLQRLRDVTIRNDYDAACTLFLGQTMYVFNVLNAPYSNTAHSIVRSALLSAKPWFHRLVQAPIMDTIIMSPMLIDTVECLAHREIPIIRFPDTERIIIDRYAGICATLLPHLYDICECSHMWKKSVLDDSATYTGYHEQLAAIEQRIQDWVPPTPPELYKNFGQHEVLAIVTQANVYRLAALLVIHRLRYPLGVEDETARALAESIFSAMELFTVSAAEKATAFPMVFPITMAMLEIEGPGEALLDKLSTFTVQATSASRLKGFVKQIRIARETGYEGVWFELVDTQLQVAMPP